MKKKLLVELPHEWVRKHRNDDNTPIQVLRAIVSEQGAETINQNPYEITVLFEDGADDSGKALKDAIASAFATQYPDEDANTVLTFTVSDVEEKAADEATGGAEKEPAAAGKTEERPIELKGFGTEKTEAGATVDAGVKVDEIMREINGLVGAAEFKSLANEIVKIAPQIKEKKTFDILKSRSYLFSIDDGCGLSYYLSLMAKLYNAVGVASDMRDDRIVECRIGTPKDTREDPFESALNDIENTMRSSLKIVCIDVSEYPTNPESEETKQFLRQLNKLSDRAIFVFRISFVEKMVLERWRSALADVLWVRTVSVPPFTAKELRQYADSLSTKYGFKIANSAWQYFDERIAEEKSDGKFYGMSTVSNVIKEAIYEKQLDNALRKRADDVIGAKDMKKLCAYSDDYGKSGWELLEALNGNNEVKEKVKEIIALIKSSRAQTGKNRPCIHMRFLGNPGTGKTTVARIIGKILKEEGVLRVGRFYEYMARDLCGKYVGQTSPKTSGICREAYGSVLFIDEAYSLFRGNMDGKDYGVEAIDTLIAEMENHRDDFVVILAGYTDEMETLMQANPGLAGRTPYSLNFPNFTKEQLYKVFESMVKANAKYDDDLFEAAKEYFDKLPDDFIAAREFGNGRFVRNLFERTNAKAAMRCQLDNNAATVLTKADFDRACNDKEFALTASKKPRLGFHIN